MPAPTPARSSTGWSPRRSRCCATRGYPAPRRSPRAHGPPARGSACPASRKAHPPTWSCSPTTRGGSRGAAPSLAHHAARHDAGRLLAVEIVELTRLRGRRSPRTLRRTRPPAAGPRRSPTGWGTPMSASCGSNRAVDRRTKRVGQLLIPVEGAGWVQEGEGPRLPVAVGQAAYFAQGVLHAKGSDVGMIAVMVQVDDLALAASSSSPIDPFGLPRSGRFRRDIAGHAHRRERRGPRTDTRRRAGTSCTTARG